MPREPAWRIIRGKIEEPNGWYYYVYVMEDPQTSLLTHRDSPSHATRFNYRSARGRDKLMQTLGHMRERCPNIHYDIIQG